MTLPGRFSRVPTSRLVRVVSDDSAANDSVRPSLPRDVLLWVLALLCALWGAAIRILSFVGAGNE